MRPYSGLVSDISSVLRACAVEIRASIEGERGRGYSGQRPTQYHLDIAADAAGRRVLHASGMRVISEESGVSGSGDLTVVIDPIDGSTNCDRGIPFYATSLAVFSGDELVAAYVENLATGTVFEAQKGAGATRDGVTIRSSGQRHLDESLVAFSGLAEHHAGWAQFRTLGAASLECCLVADGSLDGFRVAQRTTLATWDYLGGLLIAREAGAVAQDLHGLELEVCEPVDRRPVFAASEELLAQLVALGDI